jgi:pimeloyl-ACP methyl ester carboxylesterase
VDDASGSGVTRLVLDRPDATLLGEATGEGPTALLLHAGGERRRVWAPVAERLAASGFRAVAYDLRGHGESGGDHESIRPHGDDVSAMVAAEPGRTLIFGASLGGFAALLALRDAATRDRVAGLVLVDVVPDPPADRVRAYLNGVREGLAESPIVVDVLGRRQELRAAAAGLGDEVPLMLIRGGRSDLSDEDVRRLGELVPQLGVSVVPGAGHLVAHDDPAGLATVMLAQLDERAVRRRRIDHLLAATAAASSEHPGGTLLDHLHRTADTLEAWGAPSWVADAGRLHAAYGTDGFPAGLPGAPRSALIAAAGSRAERLVALYCACDRGASYPTFLSSGPAIVDRRSGERIAISPDELGAFAELTVANELDVVERSPEIAAVHGAELAALFASWRPLVRPPVRRAIEASPGQAASRRRAD